MVSRYDGDEQDTTRPWPDAVEHNAVDMRQPRNFRRYAPVWMTERVNDVMRRLKSASAAGVATACALQLAAACAFRRMRRTAAQCTSRKCRRRARR
jgi:hypothetical protein